MTQKSIIAGDYDVSITPQSVFLKKRAGGIRIYSAAPQWRVLIINDKARLYSDVALKDFARDPKTKLFANSLGAMKSGKWHKMGSEKYAGQEMVTYKMRFQGEFAEDLSFHRKNRTGNRGADYGEIAGVVLPQPVLSLLRNVYVLPENFSGVPLWLDLTGDAKQALVTLKVAPCANIAPLRTPAAYKKAAVLAEVYQDPSGKALMDSLSNWLGPGDTPEGSEKQAAGHP